MTNKGQIQALKLSTNQQISDLKATAEKLKALGDPRATRKGDDLLKLTSKLKDWQDK